MGFDWDTSDMSIMLVAKLGKPLMGTARIVINSLHIKGDVREVPYISHLHVNMLSVRESSSDKWSKFSFVI